MKLLFAKGYKITWVSFANAVEHSNIELMQWLHENGCEWNVKIFNSINGKHRFKVLNWLVANGYELIDELCIIAIANQDIKLFRWAIAHGCKLDLAKTKYLHKITDWSDANDLSELLQIENNKISKIRKI